jgi:hypothetical protein
MKVRTLLIVLILSIGSSYGTYKKGITTEEEYLYMSKGYKIAQETGLDIKKGYAIGKTTSHVIGIYTVEYKTFLKINGSDTTEVGYIVNINAKTLFGTTTAWYGIPKGNKDLLNQFFTTLYLSPGYVEPVFKSYAAMKELDNN